MLVNGLLEATKIISETQRVSARDYILSSRGKLGYEKNDTSFPYKESYGANNLPGLNDLFDHVTLTVSDLTGLRLEKENSYTRMYYNGGTLDRHIDRPELNLTVSIQIENTTGKEAPLYAEDYSGTAYSCVLENGDGLIMKGADLTHWRDPISTDIEGGYLMCVFFHWRIVGGEVLQIENALPKELCERIISEAETTGFKPSEVNRGGQHIIDPSFRTSFTIFWNDNVGLRSYLNSHILMFADMDIEGWQLFKYEKGGDFKPHTDYQTDVNSRYFTVIFYLNENFIGGATYFTKTNDNVVPKTGKLVVWKNVLAGKGNPISEHKGVEVFGGTKYILVTWMKRK